MNSRSKILLNTREKLHLWNFLKDPENSKYMRQVDHKNIWLKCSGALNKILMHPGYYDSLKYSPLKYPHPGITDIEKDLSRTGASISEMEALKSILCAFLLRNPTVGYCQGMNFLAQRLLTLLKEEEAFWVLTSIIEQYVPLDNYCNLVGVLVD